MRKFLLSGLIGIPIMIVARQTSDTFLAGALAVILYAALDDFLLEGRLS